MSRSPSGHDTKLCYSLPGDLVNRLDRDCVAHGVARSRVLSAAILHFLTEVVDGRAATLERLHKAFPEPSATQDEPGGGVHVSYWIPLKLVARIDRESRSARLRRGKMAAAAIAHFIACDARGRARMLARLDEFLNGSQ